MTSHLIQVVRNLLILIHYGSFYTIQTQSQDGWPRNHCFFYQNFNRNLNFKELNPKFYIHVYVCTNLVVKYIWSLLALESYTQVVSHSRIILFFMMLNNLNLVKPAYISIMDACRPNSMVPIAGYVSSVSYRAAANTNILYDAIFYDN